MLWTGAQATAVVAALLTSVAVWYAGCRNANHTATWRLPCVQGTGHASAQQLQAALGWPQPRIDEALQELLAQVGQSTRERPSLQTTHTKLPAELSIIGTARCQLPSFDWHGLSIGL